MKKMESHIQISDRTDGALINIDFPNGKRMSIRVYDDCALNINGTTDGGLMVLPNASNDVTIKYKPA